MWRAAAIKRDLQTRCSAHSMDSDLYTRMGKIKIDKNKERVAEVSFWKPRPASHYFHGIRI